jgi:superfamily II DNA or RNA helicase
MGRKNRGVPEHTKKEIGKIVGGKAIIGKKITIATIQSLSKSDSPDIFQAFGLIIVDECHHVSAETFHDTLSKFHPYYCYGLTATPFRKYSDGKLIFVHFSEILIFEKLNRSRVANLPLK